MEIKIEGNPGTGNTFIENKIEHIENNFPAVKHVTIVKEADGQRHKEISNEEQAEPDGDDKEGKRADILKYVERTMPFLLYQWKDKYMTLWNDILDLPEVDRVIYKRGRQQNTSFNRKEVVHIICYLGRHALNGCGIFEEYNATHIAAAFRDGTEKSTRPELGFQPSAAIRNAIDRLLEEKKYVKS